MTLLTARTEINATPEAVKAKLLAFKSVIISYFGRFKSLDMDEHSMEDGEKDQSLSFRRGSHFFRISPGKIPGTTTFTHEKKVRWPLGFLLGDSALARWIGYREKKERKYQAVGAFLKVACE